MALWQIEVLDEGRWMPVGPTITVVPPGTPPRVSPFRYEKKEDAEMAAARILPGRVKRVVRVTEENKNAHIDRPDGSESGGTPAVDEQVGRPETKSPRGCVPRGD